MAGISFQPVSLSNLKFNRSDSDGGVATLERSAFSQRQHSVHEDHVKICFMELQVTYDAVRAYAEEFGLLPKVMADVSSITQMIDSDQAPKLDDVVKADKYIRHLYQAMVDIRSLSEGIKKLESPLNDCEKTIPPALASLTYESRKNLYSNILKGTTLLGYMRAGNDCILVPIKDLLEKGFEEKVFSGPGTIFALGKLKFLASTVKAKNTEASETCFKFAPLLLQEQMTSFSHINIQLNRAFINEIDGIIRLALKEDARDNSKRITPDVHYNKLTSAMRCISLGSLYLDEYRKSSPSYQAGLAPSQIERMEEHWPISQSMLVSSLATCSQSERLMLAYIALNEFGKMRHEYNQARQNKWIKFLSSNEMKIAEAGLIYASNCIRTIGGFGLDLQVAADFESKVRKGEKLTGKMMKALSSVKDLCAN